MAHRAFAAPAAYRRHGLKDRQRDGNFLVAFGNRNYRVVKPLGEVQKTGGAWIMRTEPLHPDFGIA
ncbi:MAG: hypothetical protein AAF334_05280, partial [Pseudomonadota bacterium]